MARRLAIGSVQLSDRAPRIVAAGGEADLEALVGAAGADLIELRADLCEDPRPETLPALLARLGAGGRPVILTARAAAEGGRPLEEARRRALYAAGLPHADAIDVEIASTALAADLVPQAHAAGKTVMLSAHALHATPPAAALLGLVDRAEALGADLTKLVTHARNLGDIDTMLRLVLSVTLPLTGALLIHGAALNNPRFGAMALCGDSGAGKSTAAAAFGAACDELIVLRPENETINLYATPYWRGVPLCAPCQGVVCLLRGGEPAFAHQHGAGALRHLARHMVRFVSIEAVERAILRLLGLVCKHTPVTTARCPDGDAYIPYLTEKLAQPLSAAS